MAKVDYATVKKGGFMRQKQKNNFSLRLRTCLRWWSSYGREPQKDCGSCRKIRRWICSSDFQTGS